MKVIMPVYVIGPEIIELTSNAVESIRMANDVFLIIIDNGSPVGGGALRDLADLYIRNKENLGYAKAVNQGLRMCDAEEIVCVANNDIRVPQQWQKVALDVLKDRKVGSVHYRMIPYDQLFNPGKDIWKSGKERWCTSSFFVMRFVQYYDENYLNSYDDWDYWKRYRKLGYFTTYTNKSEYRHLDSSTAKHIIGREDIDKQNREYFKKKWGMYPEEDFELLYPNELSKQWKPMP